MVPPSSHGIPRVPRYSGSSSLTRLFAYMTLTFFGVSSHTLLLKMLNQLCSPQPQRYCYLWFGLFPFRSPLLRKSMFLSFPPGTEMFQFPGCPSMELWIHSMMAGHYPSRVSPFGYLRINACLRLPVAFRSLPRPSSAYGALASTLCSY